MRYAAVALAVALSGCNTLGGGNNEVAMKVLGNLEHCDRTYTLGVGVGATGSLVINCKAAPYP